MARIGVPRFCWLLAWVLILPNRARGSDSDNSVELKWLRSSAAASCPEQADLERLVKARLGRDPFAAGASRTIEATIDYVDHSWHAQLRVRDASGQEQGRRVFDVRAADCEPVADAVGLAVALAIDPNASLAIDPHATTKSEASRSDADARDDKHPAKSETTPKPAPFPFAQLLAPIEVPCAALSPWQAELTVRGIAAGGLLPGVAPGVGVAGYFGKHHSHVLAGVSYFAEAALDPRFAFGQTTVDIGYCHDVLQSSHLDASLCAALHVGSQHAVVTGVQPVHPGDRLFAAGSIGPRVGWRAWGPLYFEVGAAGWLPFVRPQFALIGQETPVFESQSVGAVGYLGVGFTTN